MVMVLLDAGRLAMLAFVGFVMAAQVTGLGPLAALGQHLSDPISAPPHACFAACQTIAGPMRLRVWMRCLLHTVPCAKSIGFSLAQQRRAVLPACEAQCSYAQMPGLISACYFLANMPPSCGPHFAINGHAPALAPPTPEPLTCKVYPFNPTCHCARTQARRSSARRWSSPARHSAPAARSHP